MRCYPTASWTSLIAHCCLCALLGFGCSDDETDEEQGPCPGDAAVCGDAAAEAGESGGGAGGTGGRGGSGGAGSGGAGGSSGSGGGQPDEDGGAEPAPDGGMSGQQPAMDGSQLAACTEMADCTEDRVCYQPGAQDAIGYCTETCTEESDCEALGDAYTCNARPMGMGMPMGVCRIECEGEDDMSCPDLMTCVETVQGEFRCAYVDEPDEPGAQDTQLWEPCAASSECVEGLICYPAIAGGGPGAGVDIGGFCTQPCEGDDECTEEAPSGDIEPTCGTSGGCRFDCSEGDECPDGMECVEQGGTARCLYPT